MTPINKWSSNSLIETKFDLEINLKHANDTTPGKARK
jgi:hypothetical protein